MPFDMPQAVMTSSVFVHDIQAPVKLSEFFLPMRTELRFPQYQDCLEREELRWVDWWPDVPAPGNLSLLAGTRPLARWPCGVSLDRTPAWSPHGCPDSVG